MAENYDSVLLGEISSLVTEIENIIDRHDGDSGAYGVRSGVSSLAPRIRKALAYEPEKAEAIVSLLIVDGRIGDGLAILRSEKDRIHSVHSRFVAIRSVIRKIREILDDHDVDMGSDALNEALCSEVIPEISRELGGADSNTADIISALRELQNPGAALQILLRMLPPGESC